MRVLYLHRTQARSVEGVHIRGIVNAMRQAGYDVRIVGPSGSDPYATERKVGRRSMLGRFAQAAPEFAFELAELLYDHRLLDRLRREAKAFKPDLIYERYAFFARSGSRLAKELGIPLMLEVNYTTDDPLVRRRSRLLMGTAKKREQWVFRNARVLAAVSSRLVERVEGMGVDPARVVLTPNAVDRSWWREAVSIEAKALPESFAGLPVTGYVGGFYAWHRIDRLIEAARHSKERGHPTALLLIGDGPDRGAVLDAARAAGMEELTLMPGQVPHADLNSWIAAMDVCVLPASNDYCSPMKVFEYMALGKVVLAPDLQNLRDVIVSGENGILFGGQAEAEESAAMAACLDELLSDSERRESMGRAARQGVWEHHTWQENLRRLFAGAGYPDPFPPVTEPQPGFVASE